MCGYCALGTTVHSRLLEECCNTFQDHQDHHRLRLAMRLEYSKGVDASEEAEEATEFRAGDFAAVCHNNYEWLRARVVEVADVERSKIV